MSDPFFWLGLSILLVAVSLTAVLVAALPAVQELSRAARSAEKLFDTLNRELPPTLEAIRSTGREINSLKADVSQNVQAAGRVVGQIDQSVTNVKQQAKQVQVTTRSLAAGFRAAWQTFRASNGNDADAVEFSEFSQVEIDPLEIEQRETKRSKTEIANQTTIELAQSGQPETVSSEIEPKEYPQ